MPLITRHFPGSPQTPKDKQPASGWSRARATGDVYLKKARYKLFLVRSHATQRGLALLGQLIHRLPSDRLKLRAMLMVNELMTWSQRH